MIRKISNTHPDIDRGRGRTRELLDELLRLYRSGRAEGAGEILALADLLTDDERIATDPFFPKPGGTIHRLNQAFVDFIFESARSPSRFLLRVAKDRGWVQVPLQVNCLGSATGAIFAALRALDVGGGEVITTSLNYMGVINAIMLAGGRPRFVDVDEKAWCMDPKSLEGALTEKTRAIVLTHVNRYVDLEPFYDVLKRKGLDTPVIQDATLAVASRCQGLRPGAINLGDRGVTVMSLAPPKVFCGFGGAVFTTHDADMHARMMTIGYQGVNHLDQNKLDAYGANIKVDELGAAVALEQMKRRDELVGKRVRLKELYDEFLGPAVDDGRVVLQDVGDETVMTHYSVLLPDRRAVAERLYRKHGIVICAWHMLHMQDIYREFRCDLPVSEGMENRFSMLPFHTRLSEEDVKFVCEKLTEELGPTG